MKRKKFNPTRDELNKAIDLYIKKGGQITKIETTLKDDDTYRYITSDYVSTI